MAQPFICPERGWTLTVDTGDEKVLKHLLIHNKSHKGIKWTPEDHDEHLKELGGEQGSPPENEETKAFKAGVHEGGHETSSLPLPYLLDGNALGAHWLHDGHTESSVTIREVYAKGTLLADDAN